MNSTEFPLQVRYMHVRRTDELAASIAQAAAALNPYASLLESCALQVGCWMQHHAMGHSYRASLTLALRNGARSLSLQSESTLNPDARAPFKLVDEVFARAKSRLETLALSAPPQAHASSTDMARRLHPLHAQTSEEQALAQIELRPPWDGLGWQRGAP